MSFLFRIIRIVSIIFYYDLMIMVLQYCYYYYYYRIIIMIPMMMTVRMRSPEAQLLPTQAHISNTPGTHQ